MKGSEMKQTAVSEAYARDWIRDALNLYSLLRQFDLETDIQICCLSTSEIRTYTADLMAIRQRLTPEHMRLVPPPAGMYRPRTGEPGRNRYHRH